MVGGARPARAERKAAQPTGPIRTEGKAVSLLNDPFAVSALFELRAKVPARLAMLIDE